MTSPTALNVEHLSVGYGRRVVVHDVSLPPIEAGEIAALVGPNAAGKSTLLRALAGLLPASGHATLGCQPLLSLSARERSRLVGFMPQSIPQSADLTVLDGLMSALSVSNETPDEPREERAAATLAKVGISAIALEPLNRLSGGQRQLASFAQTIVRQPTVLLLDEPTSALDLGHQFEVLQLVREYVEEGRIAIVVVHDLAVAARWSDKVMVMDKGRLVKAGRPAEAITPEILSAVYGVEARIEHCSRGFIQVLVDRSHTANRD